ncbi:MAG: flagellar hook-basal body complex protein FliE [bacterium]|nr:flagellar hook-basal body complex protein FliE [bacterium]MDW8087145.1 flagellar hook-basal body complex protein FliE [Candidatus Calescibacterium sp.]
MEKIIPDVPSSKIIDRIYEDNIRKIHDKKVEKKEERSFFQDLVSSITEVSKARKEAQEKSVKLILGEIEDIHDVMIAREKAEVLFQLFLEVRNRAVQAFENIIRAQF